MNKFKIKETIIICTVILLSGCSIGGTTAQKTGGVFKSTDAGETFVPAITVDNERNISSVDVLTLQFHPHDVRTIYVGTLNNGILVTHNAAETWEKVEYPLINVYGLAIHPTNPNIMYAGGTYNAVSRVYKTEDTGVNWTEIYTEPNGGSRVSALALDQNNPDVVYMGLDSGVFLKSVNGGVSWRNLKQMSGPIVDIVFDPINKNIFYLEIFQSGLFRTRDNGETFTDLSKFTGNVFTTVTDPHISGRLLIGTSEGIMKSTDFGDTWEDQNIIGSSVGLPVRAIAINPTNSNEFIYAVPNLVYKTTNDAKEWSTFQPPAAQTVNVMKYDPSDGNIVYAGLRAISSGNFLFPLPGK